MGAIDWHDEKAPGLRVPHRCRAGCRDAGRSVAAGAVQRRGSCARLPPASRLLAARARFQPRPARHRRRRRPRSPNPCTCRPARWWCFATRTPETMTMDLQKRSAGVLLHTTSLPGPHGIGDFGPAAFQFVDWLVSAGPVGLATAAHRADRAGQFAVPERVGVRRQPADGGAGAAGGQGLAGRRRRCRTAVSTRTRSTTARSSPWRLQQLRAAAAGFAAKGDGRRARRLRGLVRRAGLVAGRLRAVHGARDQLRRPPVVGVGRRPAAPRAGRARHRAHAARRPRSRSGSSCSGSSTPSSPA